MCFTFLKHIHIPTRGTGEVALSAGRFWTSRGRTLQGEPLSSLGGSPPEALGVRRAGPGRVGGAAASRAQEGATLFSVHLPRLAESKCVE